MQAMLVDSIRPGDWIYEIKYDGNRALALRGGNETRILSRNEKNLGGKFPEVKDAIAVLNVQDAAHPTTPQRRPCRNIWISRAEKTRVKTAPRSSNAILGYPGVSVFALKNENGHFRRFRPVFSVPYSRTVPPLCPVASRCG